jgi:hypothetical protein
MPSRIGSGTPCGTISRTKAVEMRRQGFFGAATLPMGELAYTGITEKFAALDQAFRVRSPAKAPVQMGA